MSDIITFAIAHPFIAGMLVGGCTFGGPLGIIGWSCGHDSAMRKAVALMCPPRDEAHGDVPNLPPDRPRRWLPEGGR